MGKLAGALVVLFALHVVLYVFLGAQVPGNALFQYLSGDLDSWDLQEFLSYILDDILIIGGATGIFLGSVVWRNDTIFYLGLAATMFGFGKGYMDAFQLIKNNSPMFTDIPFFQYILGIFFGVAILMWIIIVLEFARGRD